MKGAATTATKRGKSMHEQIVEELKKVAFASFDDGDRGSVKVAEKLKALEMLAKRMENGVAEAQENPLAGLTTEELRRLAQAEAARVHGAGDGGAE